MTVAAWTAVTITVTFLVIKKTIGLRVNRHEEVVGLDATEHGLQSSYADFIPSMHIETTASGKEKEVANVIPVVSEDAAVPVAHRKAENTASDVKMTKVDIITSLEKFDPCLLVTDARQRSSSRVFQRIELTCIQTILVHRRQLLLESGNAGSKPGR